MRSIALDSQILNAVQLCGRRFQYEFMLRMLPYKKAFALENGDLMHRMLKHFYRSIKEGRLDRNEIVKEAIFIGRKAATEMELTSAETDENIFQFREYMLFYQQDGWIPLEVEQPFSKLLYKREDDEGWREYSLLPPEKQAKIRKPPREGLQVLWEGIIDLVADTPHGIRVVDHKTASRKSKQFYLSNQFMGYAWAMNVNNVIVNRIGFQKTLPPKERFQRITHPFMEKHIQEWMGNTMYWVKVLVSYVDTGFFPMNLTSCDKYAGCPYQDVCSTIPDMREFKLKSYYTQHEPWSPHTRDSEEVGEDG